MAIYPAQRAALQVYRDKQRMAKAKRLINNIAMKKSIRKQRLNKCERYMDLNDIEELLDRAKEAATEDEDWEKVTRNTKYFLDFVKYKDGVTPEESLLDEEV